MLSASGPESVKGNAGLMMKPFSGNGSAWAGPVKQAYKSAIVGAGLALDGSVMRNGRNICSDFGEKDTVTLPVAGAAVAEPGGPGCEIVARNWTLPLHAASGTSKLIESVSTSRLSPGPAWRGPAHGHPQSNTAPVSRFSATSTACRSPTRFGPRPVPKSNPSEMPLSTNTRTAVRRLAHRPHSGLAYRTPVEVAATWEDGRSRLKHA